jgi:hypothetical protein
VLAVVGSSWPSQFKLDLDSENLTGHHLRAKFWEPFMTDRFLKLAIFVGSVALLAVLTLAFA